MTSDNDRIRALIITWCCMMEKADAMGLSASLVTSMDSAVERVQEALLSGNPEALRNALAGAIDAGLLLVNSLASLERLGEPVSPVLH